MDSNDKIIEEIRKYCDPNSILVIADRKLMRIRCPFRVRVIVACADWKGGEIVWVERIMITREELHMIFLIKSVGYHFWLFKILLP